MLGRNSRAWDLPALLNAADPKAGLAERNLWLVRLVEWLGHAAPGVGADPDQGKPVLRLRHLLNVLDRNPEHHAAVVALLAAFFDGVDAAALFADFGFTPRVDLFGEFGARQSTRGLRAAQASASRSASRSSVASSIARSHCASSSAWKTRPNRSARSFVSGVPGRSR